MGMSGCTFNCDQGRNCTCRPDPRARWYRLEFECDSTPVVWEGLANNQAAAETVARADLAHDWAFFNSSAKLTRCVEGVDL